MIHSLLSHKRLIGSFQKSQIIWKLPIRQQQGTDGKNSVEGAKWKSNKIYSTGRYQYDKWNIKKKKKRNQMQWDVNCSLPEIFEILLASNQPQMKKQVP